MDALAVSVAIALQLATVASRLACAATPRARDFWCVTESSDDDRTLTTDHKHLVFGRSHP